MSALALRATLSAVWLSQWLGGCSSQPPPDMSMDALAASPDFVIGADDLPSSPDALPGNGASSGCLGETRQAEAIGLDMFVMLDLSGSMLDPLPMQPAAPIPTTKWDAVRGALESFVQAPETAEIGIGLQYFPQANAGVPFACEGNADCGAGGSCTNSLCVAPAQLAGANGGGDTWEFTRVAGEGGTVCSTDADCASAGGSCRTLLGACVFPAGAVVESPAGHFANGSQSPETSFVTALCSSDEECRGVPGSRCEIVGLCSLAPVQCTPSAGCPLGAGECVPFPYTCSNYTSCDAARYATPAVDISSSEARAADAIASLRAQVPAGATPTGPALIGALEHARLWAEQHPERQIVTVLATDGFPTVCQPLAIPDIAALASAAANDARPVRTFVIGVFGDLDPDGQQRLDEIARAGATDHAIVVDTASSLAVEFLEALNVIRSTAVSCDFQLDESAGLNLDRVNLRVSEATGAATSLANVGEASACGDEAGWYYVRDAAGVPLQLSVCPATCVALQSDRASVDLEIGCATRIR